MNAKKQGSQLALAATLAASLAGSVQAGSPGSLERPPLVVANAAERCAALAGTVIPSSVIGLASAGGTVQSATLSPAVDGGDPEYCRVLGQVLSATSGVPAINFQLNLPTTWVRRSMQLGGGGFNGTVVSGLGNVPGTAGASAPVTPLRRNYATFGGDGGTNTGGPADGSFGLIPEAFANYAGEAVKRTRDAAQFLIRGYYGQAPQHQYFAGGSKGGHEGLVAAQRYGADYDGIIAYYPANPHLFLIYGWEQVRRHVAAPGGALNPNKQLVVLNAVNAACDALDGNADGIVANRAACERIFDVDALLCPGGGDNGDHCLSAPQVETMRSAASVIPLPYPAPQGGTTTGPLPALLGGDLVSTLGGYDYFNTGVIRYWYLKDPTASDATVNNFDFAANRALVEPVMQRYDAASPDLDRFISGGGKLIIVQGTTDMLVAPATTDAYYRSLADRYQEQLRQAVRYYVQPGYGHGGGVFNVSYDSLTALDNWVSKRIPPVRQVAYDGNSATAGRSMPLCEYPMWPRYTSSGDPTQATSYRCVRNLR